MNNNFAKLSLSFMAVLMLGGCSTLGSITDAINPFDKTDAEKRAEQGDVAGDTDRISILELNETLSVSGTITPDQVVLPPVKVLRARGALWLRQLLRVAAFSRWTGQTASRRWMPIQAIRFGIMT